MNDLFYVEILIILILILINGIFSLSEMAIVTSRRIKLQKIREKGNKNADIAIELADSPNQFLSTIQIGITLIGILTGAFGGATIAQTISNSISGIEILSPYSEMLGVIIVVLIITYFSLIIGELVPKKIALNNPERIAVRIARPMKYISIITKPMVLFLSLSIDVVLRILRIQESSDKYVAEEEIKLLIAEGTQSGEFEKTEEDILKRVFRLDDRRVSSIMTPKTEIIWLDIEEPIGIIKSRIFKSKRAMFPVGQNRLDNFLGIIQVKDIFGKDITDGKILRKYLKNPIIVPEGSDALDILELFKESQDNVHMAMVVDEYGSIEGLVTLNDILEAIVGDIPAMDEPEEPGAVQRSDGSWLIDGSIHIEEFKKIFKLNKLPEDDKELYQTLAGFIMTYLGRIPSTGDVFQWDNLNFEIVDMDRHQIDKILVVEKSEK